MIRKKYLPNWVKKYGRKVLRKQFSGHVERYYVKYEKNKIIDQTWVAHYLIYKKMLEVAKKVPTLDLCCGSGAGTAVLSVFLNEKIIGVDYSDDALNFAKKYNQNSFTYYEKLDLNDDKDIEKLKKVIVSNKLKQVFFIEGIEHIKFPERIITVLRESGIELILISTPFESENQEIRGYHISPFTPSYYNNFSKKFNSRIINYAKFIDAKKALQQIKEGVKESELLEKYFTKDEKEAINYLLIIKSENQEESISPS